MTDNITIGEVAHRAFARMPMPGTPHQKHWTDLSEFERSAWQAVAERAIEAATFAYPHALEDAVDDICVAESSLQKIDGLVVRLLTMPLLDPSAVRAKDQIAKARATLQEIGTHVDTAEAALSSAIDEMKTFMRKAEGL